MRYWVYKCNEAEGSPTGYWGNWRDDLFSQSKATEWGGSRATASAEASNHLDDLVATGDVVAAYQTDQRAIVGFCVVTKITGPAGDRRVWLKPVEALAVPLKVHEVKHGTVLEHSRAINGMPMLRELERPEMEELLRLAGAPQRVLKGEAAKGGYKPPIQR